MKKSPLALVGGPKAGPSQLPVWPEWSAREQEVVAQALSSGKWWMYDYAGGELGGGAADESQLSCVERFERAFTAMHRVKHGLAVSSGSNALEVCMRALELEPNDEVITTPYTFFATSSCILNAGAWPIYVDIDPQTYNLDARSIEAAITDRTRAIMPVHFAGDLSDMDAITSIAARHNLRVIEDAAQSPGVCLVDGRFAGTFGLAGIFSFQASKCLTCGEGGLITTNDDDFAVRCWSLRHCGRRPGGLWYEHVRLGWNFRMPELPAALLLAQLERLDDQNQRRMANVELFCRQLKDIDGLMPTRPLQGTKTRSHYLVILRYDAQRWKGLPRERFVEALVAEGVPASTGYAFPNFENPVFQHLRSPIDYRSFIEGCPNSVRACRQEAVWLMHNLFLGDSRCVDAILNAIVKIRENVDELLSS
jgi:dTDP-4-amino-4,6-dideoxygalactose transaminase